VSRLVAGARARLAAGPTVGLAVRVAFKIRAANRDELDMLAESLGSGHYEFFLGRYAIGDAVTGYLPIVAYVRLLDTGEWFDSLHGVIDIAGTHTNGFDGTASFSAESEEVPGDIVDVDVSFITDYAGNIDFNLSPSFSRTPKSAAGGP
jgi:hypothetical protein